MNAKVSTLVLVMISTVGCSTARYTAPSADSFSPPPLDYPALAGHSVRLNVLDHRGDRDQSDQLVSTTRSIVTKSLTNAGIPVEEAGDASFEIRINNYRADFELGEWNGCVRFTATVEVEGNEHQVPTERCVKKSNLRGYASGSEAVQQAYRDALAELLSKVDQIH